MNRSLAVLASILGFIGVALGAFGAHAVKKLLQNAPEAVARLGWWDTASKYHLIHALAVAFTAVLAAKVEGVAPRLAGWLFTAGIVLFSGSLYLMTLSNLKVLGAVTPLGGLLLLTGWALVGVSALKLSKR